MGLWEAPLAPRRRLHTTVSTTEAAGSDAEEGTGAPPERLQHRSSDAHSSIFPPRSSVRVPPLGTVDQGRAPLTCRRFAEVAAPFASGGTGSTPTHLHRRHASETTSALRPSRHSQRVAALRPDTCKVPPGRYQKEEARLSGTRKVSPFLTRGHTSRSRSRSRRCMQRHRDSDDSRD